MMDRYSRLLELSDFSLEKLELLQNKKILVVGVGGVGQTVSSFLITNGIVDLTIIDFDKVEISNLNRQILLTESDIGKSKAEVVKNALILKNSDARISQICVKVDSTNVDNLINGFDVVIDAVDNWQTKLLLSEACKKEHIPFMHIGVDGYKGQYCLFKNRSLQDLVSDSVISSPKDGVSGPMVATIASLATSYLLDYLTNDNLETDTLYFYDHKSKHLGHVKI